MSVYFYWACRLFFTVFPFPVYKAQLIGDWLENRRGAPNTIILLIIRQYYWRTEAPCANSNGGPNKKKKLLAHYVWSTSPIGGGGHRCASIQYWRTDVPCAITIADRTQKMYRNVRILSRQGEVTNGSTVLAHFSCHIKRIKRGRANS
jgi:hypothetical protein